MVKLVFCVLLGCLASTLVSSAPTEDASSTSAAGATQSEPRAAAGGANMVDAHAHLANSSFTCVSRQVGYYADADTDCKVYHFCLPGEYNNQPMYQRISYMCLNETVFDQQALDCVEAAKVTTACKESFKHFDESNAVLRKAVVGQNSMETDKKEAPKTDEKKEEESGKDQQKEGDKKDEDKKDEEKEKERNDKENETEPEQKKKD